MNFVSTLRTLLGALDTEAPSAAVPVDTDAPDLPAPPSAAEGDLEPPIRDGSPITAGSIEIVGLDDVKSVYGDAWATVSDTAREITLDEIRRHLDPRDVVSAQSDTRFMICFAKADKAFATERARQISRLIKARLVEDLPAVGESAVLTSFVAEVDASDIDPGGGTMMDRLAASLARIQYEVELAASEQRHGMLRDVPLSFSPVWCTTTYSTPISRCVPDDGQHAGILSRVRAASRPGKLAEAIAEFDYLVLTRAIERSHAMRHQANPPELLVPVSFSTLSDSGRRADYLRLVGSAPEPYRERLLLEISDVTPSTTVREIAALNAMFADAIKRLVLVLDFDSALLPMLRRGDVHGIACILSSIDLRLPGEVAKAHRFAELGQSGGLSTYALGAISLGAGEAALTAGFDFLCGPAIHLNMDEPRPAIRLNPMTLRPWSSAAR